MLNRTPSNSSNVINSYRKRRFQKGQLLVYGAVALVILGAIMLVVWLASPGKPLGAMFATDTPTATLTFTPTHTSTPTVTPTITETPTVTLTVTPSGPQPYVIQEGDSLESIAQKFNLGDDGSLIIYYANQADMEANGGVIFVGQTITIPPPGSTLPTTTPIPANLPRGTKIEYRVLPGDTLAGIAIKFNSLADDIIEANNIEDANALQVGQTLQIPVNLVTATATLPPSSTPVTPTVAGATATSAVTSTPGGSTGTAACDYDQNASFVTQLAQLVNDNRKSAGLPELSIDAKLTAAAQAHAIDMLCNNYVSTIGLDKSTPEDRVRAQGFNGTPVFELIYALAPTFGGNPQSAIGWWMGNATTKAELLNANTTVMGVAYVVSDRSLFGGYFVVITAKP
jgi:uncharacterized protein YkwD